MIENLAGEIHSVESEIQKWHHEEIHKKDSFNSDDPRGDSDRNDTE